MTSLCQKLLNLKNIRKICQIEKLKLRLGGAGTGVADLVRAVLPRSSPACSRRSGLGRTPKPCLCGPRATAAN